MSQLPAYLVVCARLGINELISAECEALTGSKPGQDGIALCETIDNVPRSAYILRGLRLFAQASTLMELSQKIIAMDIPADEFKIEVLRLNSNIPFSRHQVILDIANALHGLPNLDAPRHNFEVVVREDGFYFGEVIAKCEHHYKPHANKPYHMSSSLPAQMARALVNLAAPPAKSILDPCSGTGSILLEAWSLGLVAYGCDNNPRMVGMTRKNLEHFGYPTEVQLIDAKEYKLQVDAVVTDLPYGHFQIMEESNIRGILKQCAQLAPLGVFVAGEDISKWLDESGYGQIEVYEILKKRNYDFKRFVHKVQSRLFG